MAVRALSCIRLHKEGRRRHGGCRMMGFPLPRVLSERGGSAVCSRAQWVSHYVQKEKAFLSFNVQALLPPAPEGGGGDPGNLGTGCRTPFYLSPHSACMELRLRERLIIPIFQVRKLRHKEIPRVGPNSQQVS